MACGAMILKKSQKILRFCLKNLIMLRKNTAPQTLNGSQSGHSGFRYDTSGLVRFEICSFKDMP